METAKKSPRYRRAVAQAGEMKCEVSESAFFLWALSYSFSFLKKNPVILLNTFLAVWLPVPKPSLKI